jgi:hypothetical protein
MSSLALVVIGATLLVPTQDGSEPLPPPPLLDSPIDESPSEEEPKAPPSDPAEADEPDAPAEGDPPPAVEDEPAPAAGASEIPASATPLWGGVAGSGGAVAGALLTAGAALSVGVLAAIQQDELVQVGLGLGTLGLMIGIPFGAALGAGSAVLFIVEEGSFFEWSELLMCTGGSYALALLIVPLALIGGAGLGCAPSGCSSPSCGNPGCGGCNDPCGSSGPSGDPDDNRGVFTGMWAGGGSVIGTLAGGGLAWFAAQSQGTTPGLFDPSLLSATVFASAAGGALAGAAIGGAIGGALVAEEPPPAKFRKPPRKRAGLRPHDAPAVAVAMPY